MAEYTLAVQNRGFKIVNRCEQMLTSIRDRAPVGRRRRADAVFIVVGIPGLLTAGMIKPGAVVIDIGVNQIEGSDGKPKVVRVCGYAACSEVAGWVTPVSSGVGLVTVAILMRSTVVAAIRLTAHHELKLSGLIPS